MNSLPSMRFASLLQALTITCFLFISSCTAQHGSTEVGDKEQTKEIIPAIYQMDEYLPLLEGKKVGVIVNHTSMIDGQHLVDTLLARNVDIEMIFPPEHGFKGTAYNGEMVSDDMYLGRIPIRSLYGSSKKPSVDDFKRLDVIVFDIQDVGARFYTYISTLHYVMESAAEADVPVIILDRPNPNAHYVDGPILDTAYRSFIGMHPVPTVYGMTIGEYGMMINGESWLSDRMTCDLKVIRCDNYNHSMRYDVPIAPSPNLPNARSIVLYPSLCFLEGTTVSAGRGTDMQFQVYGHPDLDKAEFSYTPTSRSSSKYPKHQDQLCGAVDLRKLGVEDIRQQGRLDLSYIINAHKELSTSDEPFFLTNDFINKLAGNDKFKTQITSGMSEEAIRATWKPGLEEFAVTRQKYLIY